MSIPAPINAALLGDPEGQTGGFSLQKKTRGREMGGEEHPLLPLPGLSRAVSRSTGRAPSEPNHKQFLLLL